MTVALRDADRQIADLRRQLIALEARVRERTSAAQHRLHALLAAEETVKTLTRQLERCQTAQADLKEKLTAERQQTKTMSAAIAKIRAATPEPMGRPPVDIPAVSHLELIRLDRILSRLFASSEDTDVILGNQSLAYVTQLLDEIERVRPATKGQSAA